MTEKNKLKKKLVFKGDTRYRVSCAELEVGPILHKVPRCSFWDISYNFFQSSEIYGQSLRAFTPCLNTQLK